MKLLDVNSSMTMFSRRVSTGLQVIKICLPRWEYLQQDNFPVRIWAVASLQVPDEYGFPIDSERTLLEAAEAEFVSRVVDDGATAYLGSVTHLGQLVLVLHSKMEGILGPSPACRVRGSNYRWDVYYDHDPDYQFLNLKMIPTAKEQRRLRDAEVLAALAEANDNTMIPRPLTFYGLFQEREWAENAAVMLARSGFRTTSASAMPGNKRLPWSLMFTKTSSTDAATIESVSAKASEIVVEYGGHYDGWACEPVSMPTR